MVFCIFSLKNPILLPRLPWFSFSQSNWDMLPHVKTFLSWSRVQVTKQKQRATCNEPGHAFTQIEIFKLFKVGAELLEHSLLIFQTGSFHGPGESHWACTMCTCVLVHAHTHPYTPIHTRTHKLTHVGVHAHAHTDVHAQIHTEMHTHIQLPHLYTEIHARTFNNLLLHILNAAKEYSRWRHWRPGWQDPLKLVETFLTCPAQLVKKLIAELSEAIGLSGSQVIEVVLADQFARHALPTDTEYHWPNGSDELVA